jgi:competence protein ComEC
MALAWLSGVFLQLQQAELPGLPLCRGLGAAALALGAAGGCMCRYRRNGQRFRLAGLIALGAALAMLGFISTTLRAAARLDQALAPALEGRDLQVAGVIVDLPHVSALGTQFVFETESARLDGQAVTVPPRLALGWWLREDDDLALSGAGEALRAGQRWRLTVRLRAPHGTLNPHGFDLELWCFDRGLGANGSVRAGPQTPAVKLAEGLGSPVDRWRQALREAMQRQVADPLAAGVLAALAIGDQAAIDSAGWAVFRSTGVAHLMAISGLHVTMFAWLAAALVGRLWRLQPGWMLACPTPVAARLGGLLGAGAYALLAGWGVPAQRTVWMVGTVVLLRSAGLRWPLPAVLLAAGLVVALIDPWAWLQPGCWLSFCAVALLVASEPAQGGGVAAVEGSRWQRLRQAALGGLRTQAVATVGLAPLTLLFFQQISLVGFLANLVAIPLVTLVITPLALLGAMLPPLWSLGAAVVQGLMALLQKLAGWPGAQWTAAVAPAWAIGCGLCAGLLAVLPLPWRLRLCAVPLMLPMLAPLPVRPAPGRFELVAADIGQGTAVLVRTREHLLLFDTGPRYTPESDAGTRVLLPLLRSRGERAIDLLVLSHRDSDHVGGAAAVLAGVPVRAVASSLERGHPLLAAGPGAALPQRRCTAGQAWTWDGVRFEMLHPEAGDDVPGLKSNALSCVLRVQGAGLSALLTGDIEAAQEAALLRRDATALRADVLFVPHHGSRTSSSAAFIDAVQARLAVVQAGYRSRYGHPAPDVMARYAQRGVAVLRSDRCGALTLSADRGGERAGERDSSLAISAGCERETARRYWHHRPVAVGDLALPPPT